MSATLSISLNLEGIFYTGFLGKQRDGKPIYSAEDQGCIEATVEKIISEMTDANKPGVLLRKIQAGKTKGFLAATALAFDSGYDIAIVLTKPTTALAKQTCKRVAKEFAEFVEGDQVKVYDILELPERLTQYEL